jgi:hypothetical protein
LTAYPISNGALYVGTAIALLAIAGLWAAIGFTPRRCLLWAKQHWRLTVLYTVVALVLVHLVFVAPAVPRGHPCVTVVKPAGGLSFGVSCDSDAFISIAREPGSISLEDSFRQGRPLQALVAALGARVEDPRGDCNPCLQDPAGNPYGYEQQPGWLPYVVLNFLQLLAAVLLFDRLLRREGSGASLPVLLLAVLLLANVVTKNFFWSAHTQMWNILVPTICVAACASLVRRPERGWRYMGVVGLLLGFGTLAYGGVIVIVPALIVAMAIGRRLSGTRLSTASFVGPVSALVAGTLVPLVAWIGLILATTGSFYSAETEAYRQWVWMADALDRGGVGELLDETGAMLDAFWTSVRTIIWPPLLLLAGVLALARVTGVSLWGLAAERRDVAIAIAVSLAVFLPFFALQGFYRERLAFNLAVPVIIAVGVVAVEIARRATRTQLVALNLVLACGAVGYLLPYVLDRGQYV